MTEKITRQYLNFTEAIRFNNLIESEKEIENIVLKDPQTVLKFLTTITKKNPKPIKESPKQISDTTV